jgi:hypothetical protein
MRRDMSKLSKLGLEPLKITCTSSDCTNNLHCFRATREMKAAKKTGQCRDCGAQLVDWSRIHKQDSHDAAYTFSALKFELIRHKFWHVEIDPKAINYAKRKGFSGLEPAVQSRIRKSVGSANPPRDGRQTPMEGSGNVIHYAQHATASCCRKCMEYWHGIPQRRSLTEDEISYLAELAMLYIRERLPNLTQDGEKVPPIRKPK